MFTNKQIYNIKDDSYSKKVAEVVLSVPMTNMVQYGTDVRVKLIELDIDLLQKSYDNQVELYRSGLTDSNLLIEISQTLNRKKNKLKRIKNAKGY